MYDFAKYFLNFKGLKMCVNVITTLVKISRSVCCVKENP